MSKIIYKRYETADSFKNALHNVAEPTKSLFPSFLKATDDGIQEIGLWEKIVTVLGSWLNLNDDNTSTKAIDTALNQICTNNISYINQDKDAFVSICRIAVRAGLITLDSIPSTNKGAKNSIHEVSLTVHQVADTLRQLSLPSKSGPASTPSPLSITLIDLTGEISSYSTEEESTVTDVEMIGADSSDSGEEYIFSEKEKKDDAKDISDSKSLPSNIALTGSEEGKSSTAFVTMSNSPIEIVEKTIDDIPKDTTVPDSSDVEKAASEESIDDQPLVSLPDTFGKQKKEKESNTNSLILEGLKITAKLVFVIAGAVFAKSLMPNNDGELAESSGTAVEHYKGTTTDVSKGFWGNHSFIQFSTDTQNISSSMNKKIPFTEEKVIKLIDEVYGHGDGSTSLPSGSEIQDALNELPNYIPDDDRLELVKALINKGIHVDKVIDANIKYIEDLLDLEGTALYVAIGDKSFTGWVKSWEVLLEKKDNKLVKEILINNDERIAKTVELQKKLTGDKAESDIQRANVTIITNMLETIEDELRRIILPHRLFDMVKNDLNYENKIEWIIDGKIKFVDQLLSETDDNVFDSMCNDKFYQKETETWKVIMEAKDKPKVCEVLEKHQGRIVEGINKLDARLQTRSLSKMSAIVAEIKGLLSQN